ncbi:hypothetical protein JW948_10585 [bacterium]|nr:hypothetical protein [bacterium]
MDERYLMHRLRSTSLAGVIGAVVAGILVLYQFHAKNIFRWDLFSVLLVMALVKLGAMLYYRKTN